MNSWFVFGITHGKLNFTSRIGERSVWTRASYHSWGDSELSVTLFSAEQSDYLKTSHEYKTGILKLFFYGILGKENKTPF